MARSFVGKQEVMDKKPHPTDDNKILLKLRLAQPRKLPDGSLQQGEWIAMSRDKYQRTRYFASPETRK